MKALSLVEIEYVAYELAIQLMAGNEPIPDFKTRYPNVLESCLAAPFQKFATRTLYPGLIAKAAVLFYLMIKNHPFENGNKRIAVTTLLYFLHKNLKYLVVDTRELYNFAKWVAESSPKVKDPVVAAIMEFVKKHLKESKT